MRNLCSRQVPEGLVPQGSGRTQADFPHSPKLPFHAKLEYAPGGPPLTHSLRRRLHHDSGPQRDASCGVRRTAHNAPCACGSQKCRGTMYSREWMAKMRRRAAGKARKEKSVAQTIKTNGTMKKNGLNPSRTP